ncbi:predicted protein [Nematostella vectensis]|uniref:G-protein coupled receptors family 1 profile domain-containing protein n=1 Tax=Nematostella vectensis TaxID=45351 RepID=A7SCW8_NEMVE|nr:predicted protein [Nematostella vectensis]|eukprot:XP_001630567.1 predicted protein [Nematostella vectensis]
MIPAYSVIFVLALTGNTVIIYIVKTKPYMKSTTNYLIANMSVADLMMTFFAMPYSIAYLYVQSRWFGGFIGHVLCKLVQFFVGLSIAASVITLMVISLDRFFAIVYPFRRASVIRRISVTNTAIWLSSAILLSPYLYMYQLHKLSNGSYHCIVSFGRLVDTIAIMRIYNTVTVVLLYLLPLTVIAIFYIVICRKLWLRKIPGNPSQLNRRTADRYKRRTVKMLIIVVIVFAACWFPAHLMHYYVYYRYEEFARFPPYVPLVAFWITHAHSAINPFLYILLNRNFMHAFKDIFIKVFRGRQERTREPRCRTSWTNLSIIASCDNIGDVPSGRRNSWKFLPFPRETIDVGNCRDLNRVYLASFPEIIVQS